MILAVQQLFVDVGLLFFKGDNQYKQQIRNNDMLHYNPLQSIETGRIGYVRLSECFLALSVSFIFLKMIICWYNAAKIQCNFR